MNAVLLRYIPAPRVANSVPGTQTQPVPCMWLDAQKGRGVPGQCRQRKTLFQERRVGSSPAYLVPLLAGLSLSKPAAAPPLAGTPRVPGETQPAPRCHVLLCALEQAALPAGALGFPLAETGREGLPWSWELQRGSRHWGGAASWLRPWLLLGMEWESGLLGSSRGFCQGSPGQQWPLSNPTH